MRQRALSGIVLAISAGAVIFSGFYELLAAVLLLGFFSFFELIRLSGKRFSFLLMTVLLVCSLVSALFIRKMPDGSWRLFLVVSATALSDIFAYIIGKRWGRKPLAPVVSPKKTVEGTIGGILAAVLAVLFLGGFAKIPVPNRIGFGLLLGIGAMLGDLLESYVKRQAGVKDSGALLPGHGGILDRIDSHLATLLLGYAYYRFF